MEEKASCLAFWDMVLLEGSPVSLQLPLLEAQQGTYVHLLTLVLVLQEHLLALLPNLEEQSMA